MNEHVLKDWERLKEYLELKFQEITASLEVKGLKTVRLSFTNFEILNDKGESAKLLLRTTDGSLEQDSKVYSFTFNYSINTESKELLNMITDSLDGVGDGTIH